MRINETIIGINPGTKSLGLAVQRNGRLVDCRVKTFEGKWSKKKLEKILTTLSAFIKRHRVTVLALKTIYPSRSSKVLDCLVKKIEELARRNGIKIYHYSIDEIKDCFANKDNLNKMGLAEALAASNNELFYEFNKEIQNKNAYYLPMFEAVALSLLCKKHLDRR